MKTIPVRVFPDTLREIKKLKADHETGPQTIARLVEVAKKTIKETSDL